MKFPLSWLKEWIDLEGATPEQIAKALTLGGIEVDKIEPSPLGFSGVVIGYIKEVAQHPDAEKLRIATVSDGSEEFQVVCGASNCRAGIKTAFAKVGASLTSDGKEFKIKKSKLRGVESFGMLCGEDELGLGDDKSGIMELEGQVGYDLASLLSDIIFEVSLTPNLGHCTSIMGIARDLSALLERPFTEPPFNLKTDATVTSGLGLSIGENAECDRYLCKTILNVKVGPSPTWMQERLKACGMHCINNVVDSTNYVMLERGQPLHAFDLSKIENGEIRIRNDIKTSEFETLDGQKRLIDEGMLMVCDGKKPIAIAGIMGGANSQIQESTKDILLEAAIFDGPSIRKTSKKLGLRTEASSRFEKGVDPLSVATALDRCAGLIGGTVAEETLSQIKKKVTSREIHCRLSRINQLLGTHLSLGDVEQIFSQLQLQARSDGENSFVVLVPPFRGDIKAEIDLVEEVGRIYGYDNIEKKTERVPPSRIPPSPIYLLEKRVRSLLSGEGLTEFLTCNLIGPDDLSFVTSKEELISVMHPSSIDQSILRPSLLPGMMGSLKHNTDHQN
ncbi:MAG TPA: phenylalanine--tRNA ligase subunit beta, partial [Chlamydiales bacterium]|nr:phenylalanine--tRNA ligase subunit beta [Chlamydiales bacterium]